MRRAGRPPWTILGCARRAITSMAPVLMLALLAELGAAQQSYAVGIWNLQTRNLTQRATGGVRNVLLRIDESEGELRAQVTSPRNYFMDVTGFRFDGRRMVVQYGSYEYDLELEGDGLDGTMTSPVASVRVIGTRQEGLMYGGDAPARYVATRTGSLGHVTKLLPPDGEANPGEWVRSRLESIDDVALVLRGIPVSFVNPDEFEQQLRVFAGQRVAVTGEWVGVRYRIHEIELPNGSQ